MVSVVIIQLTRGLDSCKLTITTLDTFGRGVLPGGTDKPYADSDIATFKGIRDAGKIVEDECLLASRLPGWNPVGESLHCARELFFA